MKEAWPKDSDKVIVACWGEIQRGMGNVQGLFRNWLNLDMLEPATSVSLACCPPVTVDFFRFTWVAPRRLTKMAACSLLRQPCKAWRLRPEWKVVNDKDFPGTRHGLILLVVVLLTIAIIVGFKRRQNKLFQSNQVTRRQFHEATKSKIRWKCVLSFQTRVSSEPAVCWVAGT